MDIDVVRSRMDHDPRRLFRLLGHTPAEKRVVDVVLGLGFVFRRRSPGAFTCLSLTILTSQPFHLSIADLAPVGRLGVLFSV